VKIVVGWLREPLVHFAFVGALLFAIHAWLDRGHEAERDVIRVTAAEVEWLAGIWARQWQRRPDEEQLRGIVADYVREQLLAREALTLGLDVDDTVVRRRLAQKMQFLVADAMRLAEPSEDALRTLHAADAARYATPPHVSFRHIFFRDEAAARLGLTELAHKSPEQLGDPTMLAGGYVGVDERAVASTLGADFAARIFALEPDAWRGPVASAYGFHLVRVDERVAAQPRPFEEVREDVAEQWRHAERLKTEEQLFAALLAKYELRVDADVAPLVAPLAGGAR
jgi:parvulin-like peptidyl-prolyl isomerase